jgi:peptide/nickel transport system ATP-binding protein
MMQLSPTPAAPVLDVRNLHITLPTRAGTLQAVRGIDLRIERGATLGLVGESGCGKSLTALSLLRLLPRGARVQADRLAFDGEDLLAAPDRRMNALRGDRIAMVFQEPMTALNPTFTIGQQLMTVYRSHRHDGGARERALHLLDRVGISQPQARLGQYPHELSGGMRQRVLIAMALMCGPELIVADEPTTALDVTIQKQILELLKTLQREMGLAVLLITHDLGVVSHYTDHVSVMYAGQIVESGATSQVLAAPGHPYTQGLLDSIPQVAQRSGAQRLPIIPGVVPALTQAPEACVFAPRCRHAAEVCAGPPPALTAYQDQRLRRCHAPFEARP